MKPFLYVNIISFFYSLLLIMYLPGSELYEAIHKEKWLFIYVGGFTIVPVMLMIYLAAWMVKRKNKDDCNQE